MHSLKLKLTLAFLFVSLISVAILAVVVGRTNTSEFDRFVTDQMRSEFVAQATQHYQNTGSWAGLTDGGRRSDPAPRPGGTLPNPSTPPSSFILSLRRDYFFVLADAQGTVVVQAGTYHVGDRVTSDLLAGGEPISVDGKVVGTVMTVSPPPIRDPREETYLTRTTQGMVAAAVGTAVIGLLVGFLLANTISRPIRELTEATKAMSKGELGHQVTVRSKDELGELAGAFNQMSSELARATKLRRQMTADIAHDLRTPLTVMTGYLESLRDGVLKPSPARFQVMYDESRQLQRLVEDLRTLSLADAGELHLTRESVSPVSLLNRPAASFRHRAEQKRVALSVSAEPDLPPVDVDPERFAQVMGNLMSNALRYTPEGGRIHLAASRGTGSVLLTVQDNGTGIAPEALAHVFERFYRGDAARHEGESGLGLAIVKSLVEAHGGFISVSSPPGQGTTFTIELPDSSAARL